MHVYFFLLLFDRMVKGSSFRFPFPDWFLFRNDVTLELFSFFPFAMSIVAANEEIVTPSLPPGIFYEIIFLPHISCAPLVSNQTMLLRADAFAR